LPVKAAFITLRIMHASFEQHRNEMARQCAQYGVRRPDVFGSAAATEAFKPNRSDFDFLVDFGDRAETLDAGTYLAFRDALAALLQRPADLVTEGSLRNPYVRAEIERNREPIHTV
jgi:predicted nucleotidyltransferase